MSALGYVGLAYAAIWLAIFIYLIRLNARTAELEKRLQIFEAKKGRG